jgi:uncharacterized protein YqgV (UPF0045/DUF77 family)
MPVYERAQLSAELEVVTSPEAGSSPREQVEAVKAAASKSGLAHEAGPETTVLAGGRAEVLQATMRVIEAALDAGAHAVNVKVEAEGDAPRFDSGG